MPLDKYIIMFTSFSISGILHGWPRFFTTASAKPQTGRSAQRRPGPPGQCAWSEPGRSAPPPGPHRWAARHHNSRRNARPSGPVPAAQAALALFSFFGSRAAGQLFFQVPAARTQAGACRIPCKRIRRLPSRKRRNRDKISSDSLHSVRLPA